MDEKTIRKFRSKRMGWLSPDGVLHPCAFWSHLDKLRELGQFPEEFALLEQMQDEDAESYDNFISQYEDGEHIEWHHYHATHDDERIPAQQRKIANLAYDAGCFAWACRRNAPSWKRLAPRKVCASTRKTRYSSQTV